MEMDRFGNLHVHEIVQCSTNQLVLDLVFDSKFRRYIDVSYFNTCISMSFFYLIFPIVTYCLSILDHGISQ